MSKPEKQLEPIDNSNDFNVSSPNESQINLVESKSLTNEQNIQALHSEKVKPKIARKPRKILRRIVHLPKNDPIIHDIYLSYNETRTGCTKEVQIDRRMEGYGELVRFDSKIFTVQIEPEVEDGAQFIFEGEGNKSLINGKLQGDVIFVVRHILKRINQFDVEYIVNVDLNSCVDGIFKFQIPTLEESRFITLSLKTDEMSNNNKVEIISGEGFELPEKIDDKTNGDLIVRFDILDTKKICKAQDSNKKVIPSVVNSENNTKDLIETRKATPIVNRHNVNVSLNKIFKGCTKTVTIQRIIYEHNHEKQLEEKTFTITIKPGTPTETEITFAQQGDQQLDGTWADVVFVVCDEPNVDYTRDGTNVKYIAKITEKQLKNCDEVCIPMLDGKIQRIKLDAEIGQCMEKRLYSRGLPYACDTKLRGTLLVQFVIVDSEEEALESVPSVETTRENAKSSQLNETPEAANKPQDPPIEHDLLISLEEVNKGVAKRFNIKKLVLDINGKQVQTEKQLCIEVPPGTEAGTRFEFAQEGDQKAEAIPADVIFVLRDKAHGIFKRNQADIEYTLRTSKQQLNANGKFEIPTLESQGQTIELFVDGSIEHGSIKRIPNRGLPKQDNPELRGDLLVRFDIVLETKDADIRYPLQLTLENILNGFRKQIKINRKVLSPKGEEHFEDRTVTLNIKPGTLAGTEYRYKNLGDESLGVIPADIVFIARDKSHRDFVRDGADIEYCTYVTKKEAHDGVALEIPVLGKTNEFLSWQPTKFKYSKILQKYPNMGLPELDNPRKRGHLNAWCEIVNDDRKLPTIELEVAISLEEFLRGCTREHKFVRTIIHRNGEKSEEVKTATVQVKPGTETGQTVVEKRKGNQRPGFSPGDVKIVITELPHEHFTRFGVHFQYNAKITTDQLSKYIAIPTFDGYKEIVPIESCDKLQRVPGKGLPYFSDPSRRGDIVVHFEIDYKIVQPERIEIELSLEEIFQGCDKEVNFQRIIVDLHGSVSFEDVTLKLNVKPGTEVGREFVFKHDGHRVYGQMPADVLCVIKDVKYGQFTRVGANLEYSTEISYHESMNGFTRDIPTLNSQTFYPLIVKNAVNEQSEMRLEGMALPFYDDLNKFGDIVVSFNIIDQNHSDIVQNAFVSLEDVLHGATLNQNIQVTRFKQNGRPMNVNTTFPIEIKPGMKINGQQIVFQKSGNQARSGQTLSDVIFVLEQKANDKFKRNNADLECTVRIARNQLYANSPIQIVSLENEALQYTIKKPDNLASTLRICGYGLPLCDNPSKRGDLLVRLEREQSVLDKVKHCLPIELPHFVEIDSNKLQLPKRFSQPPPKEIELKLSLYQVLHGCVIQKKVDQIVIDSDGKQKVESKTFEITIKPGIQTGEKIYFNKQGDQLRNFETPCDVVFVARDQAHPVFERRGVDILHRMLIYSNQVEQVVNGYEVTIPTLENKTEKSLLKQPIIGKKLYRLKGRGLPYPDNAHKRGDIQLKIDNDDQSCSTWV